MTDITALRMERQHLEQRATQAEYEALYRDLQPGQNVYWNGFGDPPSLSFRAGFDDIAFNRARQADRKLLKGRFAGGNLGWVAAEDFELFCCLYRKPLDSQTANQRTLLELIQREGPINIQGMKEITGLLVKHITPVLHRLQEACLIYEDQYDGEWDRGWYTFNEMLPDVDLTRYTRHEALYRVLPRFAHRHVVFDAAMAKSFYKLPARDIAAAVEALVAQGILVAVEGGYCLREDADIRAECEVPQSVYAMHRNDFLVKSNEHWLKEKFSHPEHDILQYLLIDGVFHGAVVGHFRNGPYDLEDVVLDLPQNQITARRDQVLEAVRAVNFGRGVARYCGVVVG